MKKILILALMAMTLVGLHAQDAGVLRHYSLSVGFGTTGFTGDLGTMVTDYFGLRGGVDYFANVKYSDDVNLSNQSYVMNDELANAMEGHMDKIPSKVAMEGKFDNITGHALLDYFPTGHGGFHVTVGAYFARKDNIVDIYNKEEGSLREVSDFNARRGDYALVPAEYGQVAARMGKYSLMPDDNGNANAFVQVKKIRPYAGIGFARSVPESGFNCQFDLGVQFWGTPKVYDGVSGQQLTAEGAQGEDHGVLKFISKVSVCPVVSLRLCWRLF